MPYFWLPNSRVPFYQHGITFIPTWINIYIHYKVWVGEIIHPFPNLNGNSISQFKYHTHLFVYLDIEFGSTVLTATSLWIRRTSAMTRPESARCLCQIPVLFWYINCIILMLVQYNRVISRASITQCKCIVQITHYNDVIMTMMASLITSLTVVYSAVYSDADQRKHQSSASLAFVWGIHRSGERFMRTWVDDFCVFCAGMTKIDTKITLEWGHNQFVATVHISFYFPRNIMFHTW